MPGGENWKQKTSNKKQAFSESRRLKINFWKAPFSVDRRPNFRIKTASSNSSRNLTLHSFSVPTKSLASVSEILSSRLIKTFLCFSVMHGLSCQVSNKNISFKNKQTFVIMLIHSVGINLFTLPWEWCQMALKLFGEKLKFSLEELVSPCYYANF